MATRFALASASVRRQQLLRQIGYDPICCPVDVSEQAEAGESPTVLVQRLARNKAQAYMRECATAGILADDEALVVLGADTVIDLDGRVLGKPLDREDALAMLSSLSDREHSVVSGVCVLRSERQRTDQPVFSRVISVRTRVRFGTVTKQDAAAYWQSGEPADKAGSYAIQGIGAQFVAHLSGSYSNVVGLPLYETHRLLRCAGLLPARLA